MNGKNNIMKTKTAIYIGIFLAWALIIGSHFIDSPIYEEVVTWIVTIPMVLLTIYFLFLLYVWTSEFFNKK